MIWNVEAMCAAETPYQAGERGPVSLVSKINGVPFPQEQIQLLKAEKHPGCTTSRVGGSQWLHRMTGLLVGWHLP